MNVATLPMTNLFGTHLTPFLPFSARFHGQNAKILILIGSDFAVKDHTLHRISSSIKKKKARYI